MTESIELPPEFERLADLISEQPPEVRDLFRYALVLAMIDDEKARITSSRVEGNREYVTVKTIAGDVFEIMPPELSEEVEAELMEQVRAIIADEDRHGSWRMLPTMARPWLSRFGGLQLLILLTSVAVLVSYPLRTRCSCTLM